MSNGINLEKLKRKRHYVFVLAFVISAAMRPSDAISMSIMALSMYLIYEVGLYFAGFFLKR